MLHLRILIAFIMIVLTGCAKAPLTAGDVNVAFPEALPCPNYYYYYNQEKVPLTIAPKLLSVGFVPGKTMVEKLQLLRRFPAYVRFFTDTKGEDSTSTNIIELIQGTNCSQAQEMMKQLQQQDIITYANPVFEIPPALTSTHRWMAVTATFLVTLKPGNHEEELKRQTEITHTRIVDDLGNNTYQLETSKASMGNALEMANYFHEQSFVANSEPDFYMAGNIRSQQSR